MRAAPRQRSAHGAVREPEPDLHRGAACGARAGAPARGGDGRLRRHRARRCGRSWAHRRGPGPARARPHRGRAAVRPPRRRRRPQPRGGAPHPVDPARLGRAGAARGLTDGIGGPRASVGAPNLQRFARSSANLRRLQSFVNVGYRPGMATRRSAAPTLADVASEAGVSQATASRALADSPLVNANTRRRVWEVAERLRFQPNRLARSLRSGATMAVGLVVPDVGAAFYASAVKSAQDVLESAGYHVLVLNTGRAAAREREALRTLRAHQVDGLLVEHLAEAHGHERIAYMGPPEAVGTGAADLLQGAGRERLEAFRAAVGRAGLPLPPEYVRTSEPAGFEADGRVVARELMALERPPTALVGGTDELATGLLRGLRDLRLRVPEDVALVSFDEPISADLLDPPMTSLDRHDRELGRIAAEALLGALRGDAGSPGTVRVPAALNLRRSCGCP